jgi:trimeric autotransporter adhesin
MNGISLRNRGKTRTRLRKAFAFVLPVIMLLAFTAGSAFAAMPLANSTIGNTAHAVYDDPVLGNGKTADSNQVTTTVLQVYALVLTPPSSSNQTLTGSPGQILNFPHTVQNTGNGSDTFALALSNLTGSALVGPLANIQIFKDNGSGAPTGPAIASTPSLAPGEVFSFVVVATVDPAATAASTASFDLKATSSSTSVFKNDSDLTVVTGNANVTIIKSVTPTTGNPDGTTHYTYNLQVNNVGNMAASNIVIADIIPAGLSYVANSGKFNGAGFSDGGVYPAGLTAYSYTGNAPASHTLAATLPTLAKQTTVNLSFDVTINTTTLAGVLNNTATFTYNDGTASPGGDKSSSSNVAPLTVNQVPAAYIDDYSFDGTTMSSSTDTDGVKNNHVVLNTNPTQGSTFRFDNVVTNTGNGADTYTFNQISSTFPVATVFTIEDTGGNPLAVTPSIPAGGSFHVWVKVQLPIGVSGSAGYDVVLQAQSQTGAKPVSVVNVTDRIAKIIASSVDVTDTKSIAGGAAAVDGLGAGPEGTAILTNTVTAGATPVTTTFPVYINNTSAITTSDSYDLTAYTDSALTTALSGGWSVTFKTDGPGPGGACATTGGTITSIGPIVGGSSALVCAVVTVPANATPTAITGKDIFIKAASPTTAASDAIHNAVVVSTTRGITISAAPPAQNVTIGGSIAYTITITNSGNVTEAGSVLLTALQPTTDSLSAAGFSSAIIGSVDLNAITGGAGLAPGASVTTTLRVYANGSAVPGSVDVTTIKIHTTGTITGVAAPADATATVNTTAVAAAGLKLEKYQAVDAACSGTCGGTCTFVQTNGLPVNPGECVRYQIVITNQNPYDVANIDISDATPTDSLSGLQTLYNTGANCYDTPITVPGGNVVLTNTGSTAATMTGGVTPTPNSTSLGNCTPGTLHFTASSITSGATATITFGVQVPK